MSLETPPLLLGRDLIENVAVSNRVNSRGWDKEPSRNPFDDSEIALASVIDAGEMAAVIEEARLAFHKWRETTASERSAALHRFHEELIRNRDGLAELVTLEQGKPITEAYGEVDYAAAYVSWYAEEAKRAYGETIPGANKSSRIVVSPMPIGVCAAITPWNFPLAMITRKLAPAIAAGCTMIIKPAPQTPLCAIALGNLWRKSGGADGVVQVVHGDAQAIGDALLSSTIVQKLSFTGSTPVGRLLYEKAAKTIKRVSLELGGNAPFVVLADANLEAAVQGAILAKYRNAGQTCVCVNRFIVEDSVFEEFRDRLVDASKSLLTGSGMDDPDIGPLIDDTAVAKVKSLIEDAKNNGGKFALESEVLGNRMLTPSVVEVTPTSQIALEEVFGPVATLLRAHDQDHAVELSNSVDVGLAGYVFGESLNTTWRVAERLEVGMVGINTGAISNAAAPFGGVKQSGLGREGGRQGLQEYLDDKYFCIGGF